MVTDMNKFFVRIFRLICMLSFILLNSSYTFANDNNHNNDRLMNLIAMQKSVNHHNKKAIKKHNEPASLDDTIAKIIENEKFRYDKNDIFITSDKNLNNQNFESLLLSSKSAVVQDLYTGKILYDKNSNSLRSIASISKLMSAMIILDANLNMDELIVITEDDVDRLKNSGSRLRVGTILSRRQLLHLGLMSSENRAIHALGRTYPGGMVNFVSNMNKKAYKLGMYDTIFFEPTGLDPRNKSTANDLLIMAKAANNYYDIRKYSTSNYGEIITSSGSLQKYKNSNALIRDGVWDVRLQKTGYIKESGKCMVVMANLYGKPILIVLLGAPDSKSRQKDALRTEHWLTTNL